ncbi:hypothetical protein IQ03_04804 [Gemmobacter caeni]|uniref:Uncharacterized protein n=1 Tax=Gemmobacter caeni TaxID=589035 RepID=A0A2T6AZ88_9RHOB|nr:hypothetical protein [Gemmobacter caeni]PTX49108.1 hypothetical protein C8N34_108218 [Gemmobacter caeni]TWI93445.1 hypothetical protein IQ03_04804 [Gemmobacter caeni]
MSSLKKFNVTLDGVTLGQVNAMYSHPAWPDYAAAVHMIPARKRQMYSRRIPTYDGRLSLTIQMTNSRGKISGQVKFVPVEE